MNKKKWISIGTVLGETNIDHFYFSLKNYKAKKGDIITTGLKFPLVKVILCRLQYGAKNFID